MTSIEPRHEPPRTVLLCDDDRLILATLSSAMRAAGLEVIEADNGDDAILLARQHRPDLAVLDMRMNGKSGLDVAAYLRDYVGTPFLFLSAFGDDATVRQALAFGALDYLVKPLDSRRVVDTVVRLLDDPGRHGSHRHGGELPLRPALDEGSPAHAGDSASSAPAGGSGGELPASPDAETAPARSPGGAGAEIGMALGILMERKALTMQAALDQLRVLARASGQSAQVVAADLVGRLERINAVRSATSSDVPGDPTA